MIILFDDQDEDSRSSPGAVDAFEPTPTTVAVPRKIVGANRLAINVIDAAAGDESGRAMLHFSSKSDASNSMVAGFKESHEGVEVDTLTIDDHVGSTGRAPNVMKVDVETFEPEVLAGAARTIEQSRPFIVIEVLNRGGRDHGIEITQAMARFGYSYYELSAAPAWDARTAVGGATNSPHHDWLLAPAPLDDEFGQRWQTWRSRLEACSVDRNSRVPIALSVQAAMRRGGVNEVLATARR